MMKGEIIKLISLISGQIGRTVGLDPSCGANNKDCGGYLLFCLEGWEACPSSWLTSSRCWYWALTWWPLLDHWCSHWKQHLWCQFSDIGCLGDCWVQSNFLACTWRCKQSHSGGVPTEFTCKKRSTKVLKSCTVSQKASHGDISGTKSGIIDPLVSKQPEN